MTSKADYICDWFAKVASDLKVARREAAAIDPATDAACFHCQQAVEKALKAWLAWRGQVPPRTHNIEVLVAACEQTEPQFSSLRAAEALTVYAVEVRYPDQLYFPPTTEMHTALSLADAAISFILEHLRAEGVDPWPAAGQAPSSDWTS